MISTAYALFPTEDLDFEIGIASSLCLCIIILEDNICSRSIRQSSSYFISSIRLVQYNIQYADVPGMHTSIHTSTLVEACTPSTVRTHYDILYLIVALYYTCTVLLLNYDGTQHKTQAHLYR